jgi:DNA-binding NarL/FixJ family response regulator
MTSDDPRTRVLLAEHESLFRDAIRMALAREHDLVVVGEARDGLHAVAEAERVRPDVAILDADLPNCDGVRATARIVRTVPACAVLVLSEYEDEHLLVDALEAGAVGYLPKSSGLGELIEATRNLHRGDAVIPSPLLRNVLGRLVRRSRERDHAMRRLADLTPREREVLGLLAGGADNDGIALRLVISPETARTHIQRVLGKLGVHSRIEAASFVARTGLADHLHVYDEEAS